MCVCVWVCARVVWLLISVLPVQWTEFYRSNGYTYTCTCRRRSTLEIKPTNPHTCVRIRSYEHTLKDTHTIAHKNLISSAWHLLTHLQRDCALGWFRKKQEKLKIFIFIFFEYFYKIFTLNMKINESLVLTFKIFEAGPWVTKEQRIRISIWVFF